MQSKQKIQSGQNLVDFAMQYYGTAEAILKLCTDNNLNIGDEIPAGTELLIDNDYVENTENVDYYKNYNKNVATTSELPVWILEKGIWNDLGAWIDLKMWNDGEN